MSVFYCLRIERNIFRYKRRAWTCLYNVGPRSRTVHRKKSLSNFVWGAVTIFASEFLCDIGIKDLPFLDKIVRL